MTNAVVCDESQTKSAAVEASLPPDPTNWRNHAGSYFPFVSLRVPDVRLGKGMGRAMRARAPGRRHRI